MSFESLDVDTLLQAMSFMNAQTLARVSCSHKLGAVAAHEAQQRPALLVLKGRLEDISRDLCNKLAARPTVAFLQYTSGGTPEAEADLLTFVKRRLPKETKLLGAATNSLLCALHRDAQGATAAARAATILEVADDETDREEVALLVATLPEANAHVFDISPDSHVDGLSSSQESDYGDDLDDEGEEEGEEEDDAGLVGENREDAAGYPSGRSAPSAEMVQISTEEEETFGIQSLVVEAARSEAEAEAAKHHDDAAQPDPLEQLLSLDPPPSVVVIQTAGGDVSLVQKIQATFPQAAVIGGVVQGSEIIVKDRTRTSMGRGAGILAINGNAPIFALTSPMTTGPKAAVADVRAKMKLAEELALAEERRVLGALLFTCCARDGQTFGREGNDAILFQERFPEAPLMGYYAGGEIGPKNKRGCTDAHSFERGNAQFQGYTAVYGFFLVPRKHAPSLLFQRAVLYGEVQEAFQQLHHA